MRARAAASSCSATPALLPHPAPASKTVRGRFETRSTAIRARDLPEALMLPVAQPYRRRAKAVRVGILRCSLHLSSEAPHSAQQFFARKRLCDVSVCALLLAPILVTRRIFARHQNHWNRIEFATAFQFTTN